jgi:hypothetical protein
MLSACNRSQLSHSRPGTNRPSGMVKPARMLGRNRSRPKPFPVVLRERLNPQKHWVSEFVPGSHYPFGVGAIPGTIAPARAVRGRRAVEAFAAPIQPDQTMTMGAKP